MGSWLVQRKLKKNVAQLRAARDELAVSEEQSMYIAEGEADLEAMDRHRAVMRQRIARLEAEQDELLDQLGSG
jgi:primase-polymerase (primpol)-like protein